jgi:hypothetical protein
MILFFLLSILPHDTAARDTFDVCEVQDFYSWSAVCQKSGDVDYVLKPVFTQLLFRDWKGDTHNIEAWRMASPKMAYGYSHARERHQIQWFDGQVERIVEVKSMRYSSSDFDSELVEREQHGKEMRRELRGPK